MESTTDNVRSQMRKGVLEYCILCILSKQEAYASSIIDSLKAANMCTPCSSGRRTRVC